MGIHVGHGPGGDAQRRDRPDHQLAAHGLELRAGEIGSAAEFRHIGHQGRVDRLRKPPEHGFAGQRIREDDVRTGFDVEVGPRNSSLQTLLGHGVGPRDDTQMRTRPVRRIHLARHVFRARQLLVVQMAAFLWQQLVLDLHGRGAGGLQLADRAHDVQHFAVTGVGIHDERQLRRPVNAADMVAELVQADDAQVRQPHRGRDRRARDIEAFEAGPLGEQAGHRVVGARRPQDAGPGQEGGETLPGRLLDPPVIGKPGHRTSLRWSVRPPAARPQS